MKCQSLSHVMLPALLVAGSIASFAPTPAAADASQWYGRAGGPVGVEQAVVFLRNARAAEKPGADVEVEVVGFTSYGIAGGPVGAERIRMIAQSQPSRPLTTARTWHGRAGYAAGVDSVTVTPVKPKQVAQVTQ